MYSEQGTDDLPSMPGFALPNAPNILASASHPEPIQEGREGPGVSRDWKVIDDPCASLLAGEVNVEVEIELAARAD